MRLHRKKVVASVSPVSVPSHIVFYPIVALTLLLWVLYRTLFTFPVWFDETLGKAIFFGLPVWLYITVAGSQQITDSLAPRKFQQGILHGLAIGGVFGFITSIMAVLAGSGQVQAAGLFNSSRFWMEFVLALFTAFWETLLFFSFFLTVIQEKYRNWSDWQQVMFSAALFMIFHLPNILLRLSGTAIVVQILLLFLFALGQSFLFVGRRNAYTLILTHAIWGMVLLTHSW